MNNCGFTVFIKLDFIHDYAADQLLVKDPKMLMPGSHWQVAIDKILDKDNKVLNPQYSYCIEELVKTGGLKKLMQRLANDLPRFLDQVGLTSR